MHSTMPSTVPSPAASARSTPASCSSTPSQPIQIGFNSARMAERYEVSSYSSNASNSSMTSVSSTSSTASSPYGSSVLQRNAPSSYFSDAELFGDDHESPFLERAPAPPRGAEAWLAQARAQGHAPRVATPRIPIVIRRSNRERDGSTPSMLSRSISLED